MNSTRVIRHINAPHTTVYNALLDPNEIVKWKVPSGMSAHAHDFDGREGGTFRRPAMLE